MRLEHPPREHFLPRIAETELPAPHDATGGVPALEAGAARRHRALPAQVKSPQSATLTAAETSIAEQAVAALAASNNAFRKTIDAQQRLFADGATAACYYLVLTGEFIVHRRRDGMRPSIRFIGPGDFIIYESRGLRDAHCDAVQTSTVAELDRTAVDALAAQNPDVELFIDRLRAAESAFVLACVSASRDRFREPGAEQPEIANPSQIRTAWFAG